MFNDHVMYISILLEHKNQRNVHDCFKTVYEEKYVQFLFNEKKKLCKPHKFMAYYKYKCIQIYVSLENLQIPSVYILYLTAPAVWLIFTTI